jgi:lysophospholipid acyltransferase (LPLAT)-like uncharacterized protein
VQAFTRKQRILLAIVPPLTALFIRVLGATLRYRDINARNADGTIVPVGITIPGPVVFAFWHQTMLTCAHRFRNKGIAILISRSFDGELIARTVELLGFKAIRGSSSRGGAAGLRNMERAFRDGAYCAITADGPRGPAMIAKPGVTQLAQLVGEKVGTFYVLPERAWQLKSWDRFLIPKPFSPVLVTWPSLADAEPAAVQAALDRSVAMANIKPEN